MLSNDQKKAWNLLFNWIKKNDPEEPYFILGGFAGTGKTYLLQYLNQENVADIFFTATTNKATKVVSERIGIDASTIYSLLGLRLVEKEDKQIIVYSDLVVNFAPNSIIVIDEASMINKELFSILEDTVRREKVRFIFVGDPGQLPPVKENFSPIWYSTKNNVIIMKHVMRNDNQLLNLATRIRKSIQKKEFISHPIIHDVSEDNKGVFVWPSQKKFEEQLRKDIVLTNFQETKVIAWTNKTVNYYNDIIRESLSLHEPYVKGEIILIKRPVERNKMLVAHIDEEFVVNKIEDGKIYVEGDYIEVWQLHVLSSKNNLLLKVPKDQSALDYITNLMKSYAMSLTGGKKRNEAWAMYWDTIKSFDEVRYGYSLTAHRAQGSTLRECYVDQRDILKNSNTLEAYKCLYVAVTRPTEIIHTY